MPYTTPTTRSTGNLITAANWNTDLVENIKFLANPPACRVHHNANQSIADNISTVVAFNSERYDTDSMHSTSTNTSRITCNTAGLYLLSFIGSFEVGSDYVQTVVIFRKNGTTDIAYGQRAINVSGNGPLMALTHVEKLAVGNYVEVLVYQDNTANAARALMSTNPVSPEFNATWIGLG